MRTPGSRLDRGRVGARGGVSTCSAEAIFGAAAETSEASDSETSEVVMRTVDGRLFHLEVYDEDTMTYVGWVETEAGPQPAAYAFAELVEVQ